MKKLTITLLAALALGACSEQEDIQNGQRKEIHFVPTVQSSDWNTTRGTLFSGTSFGSNDIFGVSAYRYDGTTLTAATATADFLYKAQVTRTLEKWRTSEHYYWPMNGDKLDFYAYYPYNHANVVVKDKTTTGPMQIIYTVNSNPTQQVDLMTAATKNLDFNSESEVALGFTHQLTAVKLVLGTNVAPGYVKSVAFNNIATTGTLTVGNGWSNLNQDTFSLDMTSYYDTTNGFSTIDGDGFIDVGSELTAQTTTLLMIPQKFTAVNQKITVVFVNDQHPDGVELSVRLTGEWEAGHSVTYNLTTSDINELRIEAVNYPSADTWGNAFIRSAYANGDEIGLYAINNEGTVVVDNTKLTYSGTLWNTDANTTQLYQPGLKWFVYSPYKSAGLAHNGLKDNNVVTTAEDFFASGIDTLHLNPKQDTMADLLAQDLQVGTGTETSASTVRFDMAHTMGIVHLSIPAAAEVPDTVYYNGNEGVNSTTKVYTSSSKTNVAPSRDFITNKPYDAGNNLFLFIAKPGNVTLSATSNSQFTAWDPTNNTTSVTKTVTANQYVTHDVTNKFQNRGYIRRGWAYEYSGSGKTFTAPVEGNYMFECWGASGGTDQTGTRYVGRGGYVCGVITLSQSSNLYVYVGGKGVPYASRTVSGGGGWNGGGFAHSSTYDGGYCNFGGGGSTDVRTTPHTSTSGYSNGWGGSTSLNSRIIVAAGGGGLEHYYGYSTIGGYAGGIVGGQGTNGGENSSGYNDYTKYPNSGATQIGSGDFLQNAEDTGADAHKGSFGYANTSQGGGWGGGGGGGYWGGVKGYGQGGSGGSSFISGHPGCIAITSASSTSPKGGNSTNSNLTVERATHYSSMVFTNTKMIDGAGYNCKSLDGTSITRTVETMPTPFNGTISRGGNYGHGYARITLQVIE